jgi:hypothetical protein
MTLRGCWLLEVSLDIFGEAESLLFGSYKCETGTQEKKRGRRPLFPFLFLSSTTFFSRRAGSFFRACPLWRGGGVEVEEKEKNSEQFAVEEGLLFLALQFCLDLKLRLCSQLTLTNN